MKKRKSSWKCVAVAVAAVLLTACTPKAEGSGSTAKKGLFDDASSMAVENNASESVDHIVDQVTDMEQTGTVYSQTILIYMVGSDLESQHGSASLDLQEMQEALPDTENNHIVIYTGGASDWQMSELSAEENTILELTEKGFSKKESMDAENMGEAETLRSFLSYGLEHYQSDKYSLILWNHGAGPVFGFGVDENYEDILTLSEMQTALAEALGEDNKLEWIGFDACLMSSMELADAFAPYTNYLISSQETEPGWGWNYAFLSQLSEPDMDGARMGKAIIDTYMEFGEAAFAAYPKAYCDLTLSCLDLNRYQAAEDAWDAFFSNVDSQLTAETFPAAIRSRNRAKRFGSYSTDFNYSLVDTIHLLQLFSESTSSSAEEAEKALQEMVVYQRSNVANANGISVCYPYQTEEKYTSYCLEMQESIGFSENYTAFLKNCSAIENGETITQDWDIADAETNVTPIAEPEQEPSTEESAVETEPEISQSETEAEPSETPAVQQSGSDISLMLTPEQQQNFGTATYYILCKAEAGGFLDTGDIASDPRKDDMYIFIHGGKNVKMDENGVLHAYYSDNVVYMKDTSTGERSATPMVLIDNDSSSVEKRYLTSVVLFDTADGNFDSNAANLQIVVNSKYPNGIIRQAVPISSDKEIRTPSKELLDLDDYTLMSVAGRCSYLTRDADGKLLPFFDWEETGWIMGFEQNLQNGYELEVCPIEHPENYVCMFVVQDAQGNASVSELIPLG
ncbi:MAG: clostripain-related cysteine peptidase [Oscillospiraceae bacterium]|nr:clostripain-related cysteine peptidase [Oscillospiraceae bacterium]